MKRTKVLFFLLFFLCPALISQAYWVWSPEEGKFINPEGAEEGSFEDRYDDAMRFYKEKDLKAAEDRLKEILKENPGSSIAPEAQYRLGTIYEESGDYLKAFKTYKKLIDSYPQTDRFNEVIEREFRIGNLFLSGKKAKFAGLEIMPSLPNAVKVFQHIVQVAPYSEFGDQAQFHLGLAYKKSKRFNDSLEAFQGLIDQYPQSEFVPKARYQVAETSFKRSASQFRNQRALESASKQVDRFLTHHGDTESSEKAAKLRQVIDEKNAEKNYRTGLYYEKQHYLQSALIYYQDVARRYPDTHWGQKAAEKIKEIESPADYIHSQQDELANKIESVKAELEALPEEKAEVDRESLERKLERLRKRAKSLDKNKKESLQIRKEDIKRRENELKEKFKKLEVKRKLLEKNPSEDLKRAINRWNASLMSEKDAIAEEKQKLKGWRAELGVKEKKSPMDIIPFIGEGPTELEKIRNLDAKKFYKLSENKQSVLEDKELLYKQHGQVIQMLHNIDGAGPLPATASMMPQQIVIPDLPEFKAQKQTLEKTKLEIEALRKEWEEKSGIYESKFGQSRWKKIASLPKKVVAASTGAVTQSLSKSLDVLNPFDSKKSLEEEPRDVLLERRMHLKEKVANQKNLVDTLTQAFDAQLAFRERQRLLKEMESGEKTDILVLRKALKNVEKKIRSAYEEIDDRHKIKERKVEELEALLETRKAGHSAVQQTGYKVTKPIVGTAKLFKAFFVGMPNKAREVTLSAEAIASESTETDEIQELRKEVELESLMIDALDKEIKNSQKELEILKAKASLEGGKKFRSVLVSVPYLFVGEAIDSAKKVIPKKNREEVLINRLNEETQKLEKAKEDLNQVEALVRKKDTISANSTEAKLSEVEALIKETVAPVQDETSKETLFEEQDAMKKEMEALAEEIEIKEKMFLQEQSLMAQQIRLSGAKQHAAAPQRLEKPKMDEKIAKDRTRQRKKLTQELKEIEEEIVKVIRKEKELEAEESNILEKRISGIDEAMGKVQSKALSQDLLTERDRMESRFEKLQARQDFLNQEMNRFEIAGKR